MATHRSCDGCGVPETAAAPLGDVGIVHKREYCPACAPIAGQFLADRDALHDAVAASWRDGMTALTKRYAEAHPNLRLPDAE